MNWNPNILSKDVGVARILTRPADAAAPLRYGKHAGMAIVVGRRHVVTCAHVLNYASAQTPQSQPEPAGPFGVAFPLSESDAVIAARPVVWRPMQPRIVADIAVLELEEAVPEDVGIAIFADVQRPLDKDILNVFGILSDSHVGNYVEAEFMGPVGIGQAQIDGTGASTSSIRGGFSGAAVWDTRYEAMIGMVRAINPSSPEAAAYMVPTNALLKAWPHLKIETRRLPLSFDGLWTAYTSLFLLAILTIFVANTLAWPTQHLANFAGMNVYALFSTFVGLMWFRYAGEFHLRPWSSRIPRFAGFRADPGSRADKLRWGFSVFFLIAIPLYAQGHFLKSFHKEGTVLIYPSYFGFADEQIVKMQCGVDSHPCQCWVNRSIHLCEHPEAGRYSLAKPATSDKGGYWNNYYHYGEISVENRSVTFFPILQPLLVLALTGQTIGLFAGALWRTFKKAPGHHVDAPTGRVAKFHP